MKRPLYVYSFPFAGAGNVEHTIHDVRYFNEDGIDYIEMLSVRKLSDSEAYKKLFVSLSLMALYIEKGVVGYPVAARGGYWHGAEDEAYVEDRHTSTLEPVISALKACNDPFQIQAGFTLSRAYAHFSDSETAILELFKVIELFIKYCAYNGKLSTTSLNSVREARLFTAGIKSELVSHMGLHQDTVDLIWRLKDMRNKVIGHGGVRPYLAPYVNDPELHEPHFAAALRDYDPHIRYDEQFYERISYDIVVVARLLFARMCGFQPIDLCVPGCWWQPSRLVADMVAHEGMLQHAIDFEYLRPIGRA